MTTARTDPDSSIVVASVEPVEQVQVGAVPVWKRGLDIVVASGILLLSVPILVVAAVMIRGDGGPVIFRQRRIGAGGTFELRKFRSMAVDAEDRLRAEPALYESYVENGFKLPADEDPRLTRCGRFLRSTSLDELPQLLNVLRGEMSMVGPRPIVEAEIDEYAQRDAEWAYRACRPGLTGLWQVSGRSLLGYDDRIRYDIQYAETTSFTTDVRILLKTVVVVLRRIGAH